jgi:hypothetical protein
VEQAINARWGDRVNVSFSTLTCLEVMAGGVERSCAGSGSESDGLQPETASLLAMDERCGNALHGGQGCIMGNAQRLKDLHPELEVIGLNADDAVPHYLRDLF